MTTVPLTPVERRGCLLLKRDDLFRPFGDGVNGGKLRQCIALLEGKNPSGVVSFCSIHSPQLAIVPSVARALSVPCVMHIGGSARTAMVRSAVASGAQIVREASGRHSVLRQKARANASERGYQLVDYGMNAETHLDEFYGTIAAEVENLPDRVDQLVITCGSGITAAGVLYGIAKFDKQVERLYLLGTAPDRMQKIRERLRALEQAWGQPIPLPEVVYDNLHDEPGFVYERGPRVRYEGVDLHPNYEAKTMLRFLERHYDGGPRSVFWITGGPIRSRTKEVSDGR